MDKRETWVDVVKGIAIYMVVLGHCIQYATPKDYDYKGNILFKLIYGFHMPLFMMISGYLFWISLQKYTFKQGLIAKLKGIMIPCLVWGLVTYLCDIIIFKYEPISIWEYFDYTFYSNWFLWAVFYCSLYGFASKYIFRNHVVGYVILLVINSIIPNVANFAGAKRLFPFFVMGILIKRYNLIGKLNVKQQIIWTIWLAILYPVTLYFDLIELVTGTVGSMFTILVCYNICRRFDMKLLQKIGRTSIGIYLMSGILFYFCIKEQLRIDDSYRYLIKSAYVLGLSVVLTALCYMVSRLLAKNKTTGKLFMGHV